MSKENPKGPVIAYNLTAKRNPVERGKPRQFDKTEKEIDSRDSRVSSKRIVREDEIIYIKFEGDGRYPVDTEVVTYDRTYQDDCILYQLIERDPVSGIKTKQVNERYTMDKGILELSNTKLFDKDTSKLIEDKLVSYDRFTGKEKSTKTSKFNKESGNLIFYEEIEYDNETHLPSKITQKEFDDATKSITRREIKIFDSKGNIKTRLKDEFDPVLKEKIHHVRYEYAVDGIISISERKYDGGVCVKSDYSIYHSKTHRIAGRVVNEYFKSIPAKICKHVGETYDAESTDGVEHLLKEVIKTYNNPDDDRPNQVIIIEYGKDSHKPVKKTAMTYDPIERKLYREIEEFLGSSYPENYVHFTAVTYVDDIISEVIEKYKMNGVYISKTVEKFISGELKKGIMYSYKDGVVFAINGYTGESHYPWALVNDTIIE